LKTNILSSSFKNAPAYYSAGAVAVHKFKNRRIGSREDGFTSLELADGGLDRVDLTKKNKFRFG
jgi:hypothetical protein